MKIILLLLFPYIAISQTLSGIVTGTSGIESSVLILPNGKSFDTKNGRFTISLQPGKYTVALACMGYETVKRNVIVSDRDISITQKMIPTETVLTEVVITGTKTFKNKTDSPVIVNVLDSKGLKNLQVCNLSEGLKFQPGLRVETDCQTCNYTQLRMNGLAGGYSQILINGRPVFSPLMGLYGMEQLPVNMIERIEVVRGGGSSLYGSSAIGGTVNVITKIPKQNGFEVNSSFQKIGERADDHQLSANASVVNQSTDLGATVFANFRQRDYWDANGDNYSELPMLENSAIGTTFFYKPTEKQKLEASVNYLREYRFGGEMVKVPAHLTQQSEERTHKIAFAGLDYQNNFSDRSSLILFAAWQNTLRDHYTGIFPDDADAIAQHLTNPPYGTSKTTTVQGGFQINHKIDFFGSDNTLTIGSELLVDEVFDEIPSYQYKVDQLTRDYGTFFQSDWNVTDNLNLLSGVRIDKHNLVDKAIISPRVALLYKHGTATQFRLSYGTGFRAPQAFDTDLHIAFAGGGVSRVVYDPDLKQERSQSVSASVNYDKSTEKWIAGFTLEGFYTRLDDAFVLIGIGEDEFGELFEKRNGDAATVQGITLELRANYNRKAQLETGFTLQNSRFETPVAYVDGLAAESRFLRTPNAYGFANLNLNFTKNWSANLNYVYTGTMKLVHFGGAPEQASDEYVSSQAFSEVNSKVTYAFEMASNVRFELYTGVKNIFDAYQTDFDSGKNRDSNYVYGPSQPRSVFAGARVSL